jgi:hypothetical protein
MIQQLLNLFKNKPVEDVVETVKAVEPTPVATQTKVKKPRKTKPKPKKAEAVEPKVDILKFDFDPNNPRVGSIELDWNKEFIELLQSHGYQGATDEDIVDVWLNDVCKTIISNQFPGASTESKSLAGTNMVQKKNIGDGKTEVS